MPPAVVKVDNARTPFVTSLSLSLSLSPPPPSTKNGVRRELPSRYNQRGDMCRKDAGPICRRRQPDNVGTAVSRDIVLWETLGEYGESA